MAERALATKAKAAAKKAAATKKTTPAKKAAKKTAPTAAPGGPAPAPRRLEWMAVNELPEDSRNAKNHADRDIDASIARFGFTDPCEIDERTGLLVAGHGRKAALQRRILAGDTPPEGVMVDAGGRWLVPVVRGWASRDDAEAAAYLAANNQLVIAGGFDDAALADLLAEASAAELGLAGSGFSDDDLADLLAMVDVDLPFPDDNPAQPVGTDQDPAEESGRTAPKFNTGADPDSGMQMNAARRILVLDLPLDLFVWVVDALGRIADELGLDSNAATVVALAADRLGETPPELAAAVAATDGGPGG